MAGDDEGGDPTPTTMTTTPPLPLLLTLPPEILVYLVGHLHTTQDFVALSLTNRQLRACSYSVRPKTLRLLMERTLHKSLGEGPTSEYYLASLKECKFCEWFLEDEGNRKVFRETNTTRRYNLILNHETKDVCGGCLTLALVLKYCWYPWFTVPEQRELCLEYRSAIKKRVGYGERYSHSRA